MLGSKIPHANIQRFTLRLDFQKKSCKFIKNLEDVSFAFIWHIN